MVDGLEKGFRPCGTMLEVSGMKSRRFVLVLDMVEMGIFDGDPRGSHGTFNRHPNGPLSE